MNPPMSPSLLALTDQAEASLSELLEGFPSLKSDLRENASSSAAAQMVAIDVLASLSEEWEEPVERRLDTVTARLLAWQRIAAR